MKKVLIVDDTKNIRKLLTTCLELRGYDVITADCGRTALDTLKKDKNIDLIFLDIRMPEMNGTEVLKALRDQNINCPVIIMTAYATVKNAVDCTKLGAVAYMQKPFSPDRVNSVLNEISTEISEGSSNTIEQVQHFFDKDKINKLINCGDFTHAHEILKEALYINPYNRDIYYLIGKVNENMKNTVQAKRFYEIARLFEE